MSIRLPIRDREDITILALESVAELDRTGADLIKRCRVRGRIVRAVPLSNRAVYDEAMAIVMEQAAAHSQAIWIADASLALLGFRDGAAQGQRAVRVFEHLTN